MAKDKLGNELAMGDLVNIEIGAVSMVGRISNIKQPSRIVPGGQKIAPGAKLREVVNPGTVTVVFEFNTDMPNPDHQIASNMLKLVDPNPSERDVFVRAHGMQIETKGRLIT